MVCLCLCLSVCLCPCLSLSVSLCLSPSLSVCLSVSLSLVFLPFAGDKILRHSQIQIDIVTWSRLLNRAAPAITAGSETTGHFSPGSKSPAETQQLKPSALNFDSDSSPPQSTSHSGENSPKTPDTPTSRRESSSSGLDPEEVNGNAELESSEELVQTPAMQGNILPPSDPVTDADLMGVPDQIIIPPPPQFVEDAMRKAAKRRSQEGRHGSYDRIDITKTGPQLVKVTAAQAPKAPPTAGKRDAGAPPTSGDAVNRDSTKNKGNRPPSPLPELVRGK